MDAFDSIAAEPPQLQSEYSLQPEQIAAFRRDGYIVLRGVVTRDEMAAYRPIILDAVREKLRAEGRDTSNPVDERDTVGKAFLQVLHLWENYAPMRAFSLSKRLAKVAAQLLEAPAVRFYHDQVLFKEAGGGHTPWHQDGYYIPLGTDRVLTMWIPLVDVTPEMGTMNYVPGSHRKGGLPDVPTSDASEAQYRELIVGSNWQTVSTGAMQAGDVAVHNRWTLHNAGPNATNCTREATVLLYYPDGTRLIAQNSPIVEDAGRHHLGGRSAGEVADSEINPIVFP
jgi:ectoine hydroxylase-related dioxygenase (phytanoyl-CoA dioxygenase family)